MVQLMISVVSFMLVVLAFAGCTTTSVTGPTCGAKATSSTSGSGNADGVEAGSDASGEAGCVGGGIAQE